MPKRIRKQNRPSKISTQFASQLALGILVLFILVSVYSLFADTSVKPRELPISELARSISAGEVSAITVSGNDLEITLTSGELVESKKESEAALSELLRNYGVSAEALGVVAVEVVEQSGWAYWLASLLPFLLPLIFIIFFF